LHHPQHIHPPSTGYLFYDALQAPAYANKPTPTKPHLSAVMSEGSSAGTSVKSAERFGLDEHDKNDILVYKYRQGLERSSQEQLCKNLDKGMWLYMSPL
jgi:hypothetical protein